MTPKAHPLFARAPLRGDIDTTYGPVPVPYHVYDGQGVLLLGPCDAAAVARHFEGQDVFPVLTQSGAAVMVIFLCDFTEASHGPHTELHVTVLGCAKAGQVLPDDPAAALAALALRKDFGVLSLHLWNNTDKVVAYNTDYLGLEATRADSTFHLSDAALEIGFSTSEGDVLLRTTLSQPDRSDSGVMMRVLRHLGLKGIWQAMRRTPAEAFVINRKSEVLPRNGWARTLTAPDRMTVTAFDPARDRFDPGAGPIAAYGFVPAIIEHVSPFRFVYLHPNDPAP